MRLWPRRNTETAPESPDPHGHTALHQRDGGMDGGYMNIDDLGNTTAPVSLDEMMQAREAIADAQRRKS